MKKLRCYSMLFLLSTGLLMSCDKEKSRKYSTWTVNGTETFSTKQVTASVDCNSNQNDCRSVLQSNDDNNSFLIITVR